MTPHSRVDDERAAASLLAIAMAGVLLLLGSALGVTGAMVVAHRRAQSAADLAALAGAQSLARAAGDACAAATRTASGNDARLLACTVSGRDVLVEVSVAGPHWLGQTHDLAARARAGPDPG